MIMGLAALTACDDNAVMENLFLNGVGKTPVETTLLLGVDVAPRTRAANKEFMNGDKLLAYLRHVTWDGGSGARTVVTVQKSPSLVTFTKGSAECVDYSGEDIIPIGTGAALGLSSDNTMQTSDLTASPALYWDDFSRASTREETEGDYDIRTSGHYLQSYYGYCFNGGEGENNEQGNTVKGNISAALNETTGVLGWTVPYDQTTQETFSGCDLLWSAEQNPISYAHGSQNVGGQHGTLILPYTHAMSMVTVDVVAKDGFTTGALANTWLELQGMNKTATFTAPILTITDEGQGTGDKQGLVKMLKGTPKNDEQGHPRCTFQALVVPGTALSQDAVILKINDADGNNYDVKVTSSILTSWNSGLVASKMKPGYNYHLTVTINKVGMDVQSTLSDWKTVEAEGEGDIQFPEDEVTEVYTTTDGEGNPTGNPVDFSTTQGKQLANFNTSSSFSLYKKGTGESDDYTYATTSTYTQGTGSTKYWKNDPEIYWPNDHDKFYFRALAIYKAPAEDGSYNIQAYTPTSSHTVTQATDYVWATTPAHKVKKTDGSADATYAKGAAITPRTGDVPLAFEHVMSKITVKLATSTSESGTPADAVELEGALVSISKLATSGTINVEDGAITIGDIQDNPISEFSPSGQPAADKTTLDNYAVVPQTITNDAVLTVTLANGTTYKLQLNTCVQDGTTTTITQWLRGIHYTYTITLTKEAIKFRVMIKKWDEKKGSGNANLDWD